MSSDGNIQDDNILTDIEMGEMPNPPPLMGGVKEEGENLCSDTNIQNHNVFTDIEMGEMEIVLSWVETNKDQVNYINMDTVSGKDACLKILGDYLSDEETFQKKHFRWL